MLDYEEMAGEKESKQTEKTQTRRAVFYNGFSF